MNTRRALVLSAGALFIACASTQAVPPTPLLATLPTPSTEEAEAPSGARSSVVQIALSNERSCARLSNGTVRCWGLGFDDVAHTWPTGVSGLTDAVQIAIGQTHGCARLASGRLRCWGTNESGALGDGTHKSNGVAVADPGVEGAVEVTVGTDVSCARKASAVVCWGSNQLGALALGTLPPVGTREEPRPTLAPLLGNARRVTLAAQHGLAILADGAVVGWGDNLTRLFGTTGVARPRPVTLSGLAHARDVALARGHACAVLDDGGVSCFGDNDAGQLGDGTHERHDVAVKVKGVGDVVQLTAAERTTCARTRAGTVFCWGDNDFGQLGDGTTLARDLPTRVPGLSDVVDIAVGGTHACALSLDGSVQCWGSNTSGELGDHTKTARSIRGPVLF